MLNVTCLYCGTAYDVEYVKNLSNTIKRNLKEEYSFNIFTDRNDQESILKQYGKIIYLPKFNFNRLWWNKLWIFSKDTGLEGKILYLDLDVIVRGGLDKFVTLDDTFKIIHDFNRSNVNNFNGSNSSIMSWNHQSHRYIWDRFQVNIPNYTTRMRGDQDFIHLHAQKRVWYPQNWAISYRWEYLKNKLYNETETSVFVFHGKPKPIELQDKKLLDIWRLLA